MPFPWWVWWGPPMLAVNFLCVLFLLVRWRLVLPLLNAAVSPIRRRRQWRSAQGTLESAGAAPIVLNVHFLLDHGWSERTRLCITNSLLFVALSVTMWWPSLPALIVFLYALADVAALLLSPLPCSSAFKVSWNVDRYGVPCGYQELQYDKHVVFTGGVILACYACGVLQFMFERYGTSCFRDCDFVGASSGALVSTCATFAAHGAGSVRELFDLAFGSAFSLLDLFPCGLLFLGCQAIEEFTTFLATFSKAKEPHSYDAVMRQSRMVIWLFGFSLRRGLEQGRASYRLAMHAGEDFADASSLGALVAATSVFPYFTSPRLHSHLHCMTAAMDGYFPGKGWKMLPIPDLPLPCKSGKVLLFDISGGLREVYAGEENIHVLDIRKWDNFTFHDYTASSPAAIADLFARGLRDAAKHTEELDMAMLKVFGIRPSCS